MTKLETKTRAIKAIVLGAYNERRIKDNQPVAPTLSRQIECVIDVFAEQVLSLEARVTSLQARHHK